jgi:hypothetical protein
MESQMKKTHVNICIFSVTVEVNGRSEPINYAQLASWLLPSGGNIGPGGGGGGGSGIASSSGQKAANNEQKTDCEKYVNALVGHASGYKSNYPMTGSVRFGDDLLKNRAFKGNPAASFGMSGHSGFKNHLVNNGQGSDVYRHVSGALGSTLLPFGQFLPIGQSLFDDLLKYLSGNSEGLTEIRGNIAGMLLAPGFSSYFMGFQSAVSLKKNIMKILCDR